jgi:hypothetical protein
VKLPLLTYYVMIHMKKFLESFLNLCWGYPILHKLCAYLKSLFFFYYCVFVIWLVVAYHLVFLNNLVFMQLYESFAKWTLFDKIMLLNFKSFFT